MHKIIKNLVKVEAVHEGAEDDGFFTGSPIREVIAVFAEVNRSDAEALARHYIRNAPVSVLSTRVLPITV